MADMGRQRGQAYEHDYDIPRMDDFPLSRRLYLALRAMDAGSNPFMAIEAVSTTAMEHPDWDMEEWKTWEEWHDELG